MQRKSTGSYRWVVAIAILGCCFTSQAQFESEQFVLIKGHRADPVRILARFKSQVLPRPAAAVGVGFNIVHRYQLVPGLVLIEIPDQGPIRDESERKRRSAEMAAKIEELKQSGLFYYVEPDYLIELNATPNDTAFSDGTLWGLRNIGQNGGTPSADIGAVQGWDITTGSSDVIVAVIDTGVRYTHRDLAANMWRNPGEIPGNFIDDDADGYVDNVYGINAITDSGDPMDDNGHGTHVAGTIGAAANDGNQHVGVAWSVRLMALKFLGLNGGKTSDGIKCIEFAVSKGARIINASYGSTASSQSELEAINRANERGVLFVAAAGNNGTDNEQFPHFPSNYPIENIISVAAHGRTDNLASFSNYGLTTVDVGAPGEEIFSCWKNSDTDYRSIQGTSMAAPHVSGVAALVLSRFPDMPITDLRRAILNSVVPVPALQGKTATGGRVNAFNALNAVADGKLELGLQPHSGSTLLAGSKIPIVVSVFDVAGVTDATITANIVNSTNVALNNAGTAPDAVGGDADYSAAFNVPPFANSVTLSFAISAPGKTTTNLAVAYQIVPPVVNDAFAKRAILPSVTTTNATGFNIRASREAGEPYHGGHVDLPAGGKSAWWSWTAPENGVAVVSTAGSDFDTLLAVYSGSELNSLTLVASNDDDHVLSGQGASHSLAGFDAIAGVTYQIAVDGFGGASGRIELELLLLPPQPPPGNDNFQNRLLISGSSAAVLNAGATKEPGEPTHDGNTGGRSVWYTWTSPAAGLVDINTSGASFDTLLAVYSGSSVSGLTLLASNDDEGVGIVSSRLQFGITAGVTVQIAVDGFNGAVGAGQINVSVTPFPSGSANDDFQNASELIGVSASVTGSNVGASIQSGEPYHAGNAGGRSVWWRWTASASGVVSLSSFGSSFDTLLAVYTGGQVHTLTLQRSNDEAFFGSRYSRLSFFASAGTTYQIAVDGYRPFWGNAAAGTINLSLTLDTGLRPPNDNFANRILLAGNSVSATGTNIAGTKEASEPTHAGNAGGRSVWWTWTAPATGIFEVSTAGSTFDTLLAVYGGQSLGALSVVSSNDQDPAGGNTSRTTFLGVQGESYQIAVDGFGGAQGVVSLSLKLLSSVSETYLTGFESAEGFATGFTLAGQGGWLKAGTGGNGLVTGAFPGSGQQAFVGFTPPTGADSILWLYRPVNVTFGPGQSALVGVRMRIVDSTNGRRDTFRWGVFNRNGEQLCRLIFDNETLSIGYALDDNVVRSTGFTFNNSAIYQLVMLLDFPSNRWTAWLGGVPIVLDQPLSTKGAALDLGDVDAGWALKTVGQAGNNHMLFDDFGIGLQQRLYRPSITTQPLSQTATAGDDVSLAVVAIGTELINYQWLYEGTPIEGASGSTLSLDNVQLSHAGRYSVIVSNVVGVTPSAEVTLLVRPAPVPPSNDLFENRISLVGTEVVTTGSSTDAGKEPDEPAHAGNTGGRSIWWSWTAPSTGQFLVSTTGSDFDTLLAVYSGASLTGFSAVVGNDDLQSQTRAGALKLGATSGVTYQIAVDGYNGSSGIVRLLIKPTTEVSFTQPAALSNGVFQMMFLGEPGVRYLIQASPDLEIWTTLATVIGQDGTLQYFDTESLTAPSRFYRALQEP